MARDIVNREARDIAHDAQKTRGLTDREGEILRDLLQSDEVFYDLVVAQQRAVRIDVEDTPYDKNVEKLARLGSKPLGDAIDDVIDQRIDDARAIAEFAEALDRTWLDARTLYVDGFETVADVRGVDVNELVAETQLHPSVAEEVVEAVEAAEVQG